ncbi:MAG: response regulator, partial [Candidatus Krumholzibacteriia bacterium]
MNGRKTVLVVEDDPGILHVLGSGLSTALEGFDIVTACNGQEAVEELERRTVDVLVTDLAMPIMDGFSLIGYITNRRSTVPVIVLSGMAPHTVDSRLTGFGGLRVLRKPAGYRAVAEVVREEIARVDRGQVEGIPLAAVLQLLESERRTCTVVVRSGRRRGSLHFESGRLINAFSDDFGAEGEAAAFDILGWTDTAIEFEPSPLDVRRLVNTSLQRMLIELAAIEDHRARQRAAGHEAVPEQADSVTSLDDSTASVTQEAPDWGAPEREERQHPPMATEEQRYLDLERASDLDPASDLEPPVDRELAYEPAIAEVDPVFAEAPNDPHASSPSVGATALGGGYVDAQVGEAAATEAGAPATEPDGDHVRRMITAIERLARRAREADAALAAVAVEVEAFHEARRRFDAVHERQQRRRRELEAFREDVGRLAREILGRLDGLFDAMAADA